MRGGDGIHLVLVWVVYDVVPMTERAALTVLARQAHVMTLHQQRAVRHRLAQRPVHQALLQHLGAVLEDAVVSCATSNGDIWLCGTVQLYKTYHIHLLVHVHVAAL